MRRSFYFVPTKLLIGRILYLRLEPSRDTVDGLYKYFLSRNDAVSSDCAFLQLSIVVLLYLRETCFPRAESRLLITLVL